MYDEMQRKRVHRQFDPIGYKGEEETYVRILNELTDRQNNKSGVLQLHQYVQVVARHPCFSGCWYLGTLSVIRLQSGDADFTRLQCEFIQVIR